MDKAGAMLKNRPFSLETSDQKMEAAVGIWQSTEARCKTDTVVAHIMAKLKE
jgi:hypothetical protein